MAIKRNIVLLITALAVTHLYKRIQTLWNLEKNAPEKLQAISAFSTHEIKFADQIRNCEDGLLLDDSDGWALLSCDSGRDRWNTVMGIAKGGNIPQGQLYLYNYASGSAEPFPLDLIDFPSAKTDFHPLGIEYHAPSKTLYVVNHARAGSCLELFKVFLDEHFATHIRTISHPKIHSPNAIAVIDEENVYLTNDHFFLSHYHPWLTMLETYLGIPGGNVAHVHIPTTSVNVLTHIPFANGIALINDTTLAVASTSTTAVNLYSVNLATHALKFTKAIQVPFTPDNLSVDGNGKLLIAGHGHSRSLNKFADTRDLCRSGSGEKAAEACKLTAPSYAVEWTEKSGVHALYLDDRFSSGCTAFRDVNKGVGILTGLFADGLLLWRE